MNSVTIDHATGFVDCTNDQYHSGPGISKSHLDAIAGKSPKHYWHKYINPERERQAPSAAMQIGTAIHTVILEPELMDQTVVRGLSLERRSSADKATWAEFEAKHRGKVILKDDDYEKVLRIRDAVHSHPMAGGLLAGGKAEQSIFAKDESTGELIKCRTDYMLDGGNVIVDLKSTDDASPDGFGKSAANFRYDVQVAWYFHVMEQGLGWVPHEWVFIAVEKEPPYAIGIYLATPSQIERARETAMRNYREICHYKKLGIWPDYGETPLALELPGWIKR